MENSTLSPRVAKLTAEIVTITKKRDRHQAQCDDLTEQIEKLKQQHHLEVLRGHIGGTVVLEGGNLFTMQQWFGLRAKLEGVGRKYAHIDFGDRPGKYSGQWNWTADGARPLVEGEAEQ